MKTALRYHTLWLGIGIALVLTVITLSLIPSVRTVEVSGADKISHLLAYGTLMFWFAQLYGRRWLIGAVLISLGILIEFAQGLTGYRSMEVYDALANTIGVILGGLLAEIKYFRILQWCEGVLVVRK